MRWFKKTAAPTDDPLPGLKMPEAQESDWAEQTTKDEFIAGLGQEAGAKSYELWSGLVDMKNKASQEIPEHQRRRDPEAVKGKVGEAFSRLKKQLATMKEMDPRTDQARRAWSTFASQLALDHAEAVAEAQQGPEKTDPWAEIETDEPQVTQQDPLEGLAFSPEEEEEFRKQWSSHGKETKLASAAVANLGDLATIHPEVAEALRVAEKAVGDRIGDAARNPRLAPSLVSKLKDRIVDIAKSFVSALAGPAVTQKDPAAPTPAETPDPTMASIEDSHWK
jgi:hypothetical protein